MSRNIIALSRIKACIDNRTSAILWCNGKPSEMYALITQDLVAILGELHLHALLVSASLQAASQQGSLTILEFAASCMPAVMTTAEMKAMLDTSADQHGWKPDGIASLLTERGMRRPHWLTEAQLQVVILFDVFLLSAKALSLLDATFRAVRGAADVDTPMGSGISVVGIGDPYDNRSETSAFGSKAWRRLFRRNYFCWAMAADSMHTFPGQTIRRPKRILRRDQEEMTDALHYMEPRQQQQRHCDKTFNATDGYPETTPPLSLHSWPVPATLSLVEGDSVMWIQESWPQTPALLVEVVDVDEDRITLQRNSSAGLAPDTWTVQTRTFRKRLFLGPETPAGTFSRTTFPLVSTLKVSFTFQVVGHARPQRPTRPVNCSWQHSAFTQGLCWCCVLGMFQQQTTDSIKVIRPHKLVLHGTVTVSQAYQLRDIAEMHIATSGKVDTAVLDEDTRATRTFEACRSLSTPPRVGSKVKIRGLPGVHKIVASGDGVFPILYVEGSDKKTRQYFRYLMDYSYV